MGRHRLTQILEHRTPLSRTRRDYRPDPLTPAPSSFAARPLRDVPIDDHKPDRLLSHIVRRFQSWRRDKPEITFAMLPEPFGEVLTMFAVRCLFAADAQHTLP